MALSRDITTYRGTMIAVSMVIGSGLFALPGLAIGATDPVTALAAWVIVTLCMLPIIAVFSDLGRRRATSDGVAGFAASAIGDWSRGGFSLIACGAVAIGTPAFFLVIGAYVSRFLDLEPTIWRGPIAILLTWLSTLMNLRGMRNVGAVNQLTIVAVIVMIAGIIGGAAPHLEAESAQLWRDFGSHTWRFDALWTGSAIVFWAFQGWESLSFGLGEFKDPERTIPRVFWFSFLIVAFFYLSFAWVVSASTYSGVDVAGLAGISALLGSGPLRSVLLVAMITILFANANSWVFGASRAFYSASSMGFLPNALARTDEKGLPVASLVAAAVVYSAIVIAVEALRISETSAFVLTTQGFIVLYGFSILAYLRLNRTSPTAWAVSTVALVGWLFLMSGFSLLIFYPAGLFTLGVLNSRRLVSKSRSRDAASPSATAHNTIVPEEL